MRLYRTPMFQRRNRTNNTTIQVGLRSGEANPNLQNPCATHPPTRSSSPSGLYPRSDPRRRHLFAARNPPALILGDTAMTLRFDHAAFLRATFRTLATSLFLNRSTTHRLCLAQDSFEFFAQLCPRQFAIRRLRTLALTTHFNARRPVPQPDR